MNRKQLNFADSYALRVKEPKHVTKSVYVISSEAELVNIIERIIRLLGDPTATEKIECVKAAMKWIRKPYNDMVATTLDEHHLDLLHHAILNNCPEVVKFFLTQTSFFPVSHFPKSNPYAHLAAVLGYTDCLQQILQYRPLDYFRTYDPERHVINLPRAIEHRIGLDKMQKSRYVKSAAGLLEKIKTATIMAEMKRDDSAPEDIDITELLGLDQTPEENKKKTKRLKPLQLQTEFEEKQKRVLDISNLPSPTMKIQLKPLNDENNKLLKKDELEPAKPEHFGIEHFEKTLKPKSGKHVLTVYWDVCPHSYGVLRGAGQAAIVKFKERIAPSRIPLTQIVRRSQRFSSCRSSRSSTPSKPEERKLRSDSVVSKTEPDKDKEPAEGHQKSTLAAHPSKPPKKNIELGVRGQKKYKDFHLTLDTTEKTEKKDLYKTPLHLAAELGHSDCVQLILRMIISKSNPKMISHDPITLATKARSPESILLLLSKKMTLVDYQGAVLLAIREQYPDCLSALLCVKSKERRSLFNGTNLFHILYSQSLMSNYRYELMPEMTRVMIERGEDVNDSTTYCTFPMYTLINCAFHITLSKQIFYYVECFKLLLEAKANPFFNEQDWAKYHGKTDAATLGRMPFVSAIQCLVDCAVNSTNFLELSYWSKLFLRKFILTLEANDKTRRRIQHHPLFVYIGGVCQLGLDHIIIRALLRYGCNPDHMTEIYAVNYYFDKILPYLAKFEIINSYDVYKDQLSKLKIICEHMSPKCLREAEAIFLDKHLLSAPVQAVPICRYFAYLIMDLINKPRPLAQLTAISIWKLMRRNVKRTRNLPLPEEFLSLIIP